MSMPVAVDEDPKIAVVKEGINDRESSVLVVEEGGGMDTVEFPDGTAGSAVACRALRACWRFLLFRWEVVRGAAVTASEDTPDSAVAAVGCPEEDFFFLRGHEGEDERWPTTLQVRHVFGERIHQAWTFSPNSSKRVGASKGSSAGVLITRSQRRVIHWRVAMRCGPISTISPCDLN